MLGRRWVTGQTAPIENHCAFSSAKILRTSFTLWLAVTDFSRHDAIGVTNTAATLLFRSLCSRNARVIIGSGIHGTFP